MAAKTTELALAENADRANDLLMLVDVSDTSMGAGGTNKGITPEDANPAFELSSLGDVNVTGRVGGHILAWNNAASEYESVPRAVLAKINLSHASSAGVMPSNYVNGGGTAVTLGTLTEYLLPVRYPLAAVAASWAIRVAAAQASALIKSCFYVMNADGTPGTQLDLQSSIDASTTGVKTISSGVSWLGGEWYWWGLICDTASVQVNRFDGIWTQGILGNNAFGAANGFLTKTRGSLSAGLPATQDAISSFTMNGSTSSPGFWWVP